MLTLDDYHEIFLIGLVSESTTIHLHELCQAIYYATNVQVSVSTVCCVLKRYGFTRKQVQRVAIQRSTVVRASFMANMFLYNCASFS